MAFSSTWLVYALGIAVVAMMVADPIVRFVLATRRPKDYPPGPKTTLGLGNLHQIPLSSVFVQFTEWSKVWGDVVGLKAGPANLVILNSATAVHDLFSKRGAVYSDRPGHLIAENYLYPGHAEKHVFTMKNDAQLRWFRTAVTGLFNAKVPEARCLDIQNATGVKFAHEILSNKPRGFGFDRYTRRWALETALLVSTGHRLDQHPEGFVDHYFEAQDELLELLTPGLTPPVDILPFLRWVPEALAGWKQQARQVRNYMRDSYGAYLEAARRSYDSRLLSKGGDASGEKDGAAFESLVTRFFKSNDKRAADDAQLRFLGGTIVDASVDTTWTTITSTLLHLAAFPEIQAKAQEEIDRVAGDALPGVQALHELPYLQACLLEVLRVRPAAPLGLAHQLSRDDAYRGFVIPKDTTVLANIYAIGHDPDAYDEPYTFKPERYLRHPHGLKDGALVSEAASKQTHAFGVGRRMCAGEQFARNSILLAVSKLLWAFDIVPSPGVQKLDLGVETGYIAALTIKPKPFNVEFKLRAPEKEATIRSAFGEAARVLNEI